MFCAKEGHILGGCRKATAKPREPIARKPIANFAKLARMMALECGWGVFRRPYGVIECA
eukprot:SAG11_NODE_279_length_11283_cov_11.461820_4_plen_59_part_00